MALIREHDNSVLENLLEQRDVAIGDYYILSYVEYPNYAQIKVRDIVFSSQSLAEVMRKLESLQNTQENGKEKYAVLLNYGNAVLVHKHEVFTHSIERVRIT